MATKVIARIGTAAQIPLMPVPGDVGEIGFLTDIKAGVLFDGSTNPPEFMTTKSTGNYDFSSTNTATFNNISANSYNGVNLGQINSANGIIVRTGNGTFSARNIVSTDNSIKVLNPDGVSGNMNITVNPNADLSAGQAGIVLPQGTTAQRPANPKVGTLRYCVNSGDPYSIPEIFSVDSTWHSLKEFIYNGDYTLTVNPNAPAGTVQCYSTIQQALLRHLLVDCSGKSIVSVPEGVFPFANAVNISNPNKEWSLQGIAPTTANVLGVAGVTGTNGLWTVVLNVDNAANMNVGNYLMVDSLRGYSTQPHRGLVSAQSGTSTINSMGGSNPTSFLTELNVNDYVTITNSVTGSTTATKTVAKVTAIPNSATLQINGTMPFTTSNVSLYSSFQLTGTLYANSSNPSNVIGLGTIFTTELNVNDIITVNNEPRQVIAISNDSSLTIANQPFYWPTSSGTATIAYANNNPELHQGCFKIVAVDSTNKKVTVLNNNIHQPPINKVGVGTLKVIKSVVSFANPVDGGFNITNGSNFDIQNIVVISSSGSGVYGINATSSNVTGADVYFSGFTANQGAGIMINAQSTCVLANGSASLGMTNCYCGIICQNGSTFFSTSQIIISNCSNAGVFIDFGSSFLCSHINTGSFKSPLSVVDCTYNGLFIANSSYAYVTYVHVAYCQTNFGVLLTNQASLLTAYGLVIHDCQTGGINATINSFASINCSYIFNIYNAVTYGFFISIGSSIISYYSTIANVCQAIYVTDTSVLVYIFSFIFDSFYTPIFATINSNANCRGAFIYNINPNIPGNGNSAVSLSSGSSGIFDYAYFSVGSSSVILVQALNGSFASTINALFNVSTLLSPTKNTVGNGNSYIAN